MKYRNLLFPVSLAVILGGLSAWLERVSTISVEEVKLDPAKPQYLMDFLTANRFDESGSLKESLIAKRAWQLPDQENIYLEDADLQTFVHGEPLYSVNGLSARYHVKEKKAYFESQVVLKKNADARHPAARVDTEQLVVDTVTQTAQTDAPISFRYGLSSGSAVGAFYDHKSGKLDLHHKVKALIYNVNNQSTSPIPNHSTAQEVPTITTQ